MNWAASIRRMVSVDQPAEFVALLLADGGTEVLDLDQPLADENDLGDIADASDPAVANQLRIQHQQSLWFFRIPSRSGLPLQQAASTVQVSDRINVGNEVIPLRQ